ncbi:hypothetical protein SerAS12_1126 [Serratia sp. AS12]|uniref:hypothetical protein n=1 Tax=Serratia TaxID=613 RepID=UPI00020E930D|nr:MULTISPECIES: hypothetical protein [Serratia]AEF44269.1 hypothetical protein SerAS9_1126 [Serratia plymuthica AS9]AEF49221.1 hypothetical protein SerAS12_1126 [Serratia sp. AS12]AEG26928.1 hypothetical protein SerAS13_1126 [Serratia sp. AS13]UTN97795.1 hypothetical protein NLX81_05830 [Serratia plymuthica]
MTSLQDIKPEQVNALNKQSRDAYNAEVQSREALVSKNPQLKPAFNQQVHPQSLCGCGCQQNICGYFSFQGCGCGCGCAPHAETVQISAQLANIGPDAPSQGTLVNFIGQVTGSGSGDNINISTLYLQGTVPDAENLIRVPLTLQLVINPGSLNLTLLENGRVLASLVHPSGYAGSINGQFFGVGNGEFVPA